MLIYRLISTVSLIPLLFLIVLFGSLLWVKVLFFGFAGFFLVMALHEFFQLSNKMGYKGFPFLTYVCSILLLLSTILEFPQKLGHKNDIISIVLLFMGGIIIILQTGRFAEDWTKRLFPSIAAFFFLAWPLSFLLTIFYTMDQGPYLFLFVVLVVKFADVGGYVTGKLMSERMKGAHKLVPTISPEKSWEGLGGSFLFSVITAWMMYSLCPDFPLDEQGILMILILTVGLVILGLLGDLAGSALKRGAKSEDSGKGIPGIGGFIDFLDSFIFVSPLFYYYLQVIA